MRHNFLDLPPRQQQKLSTISLLHPLQVKPLLLVSYTGLRTVPDRSGLGGDSAEDEEPAPALHLKMAIETVVDPA